MLDYKTRSAIVEAGLTYPVIRSRETNLHGHRARLHDQRRQLRFGSSTVHARPAARLRACKADADWADSFLGINQVNVTFSQGIQGSASTRPNGNPLAVRASDAGRVDFTKIEATVSRLQPLFGELLRRSSRPTASTPCTPLLVSEQCGYGGRFFGRAYDPSQLLGDHCWMVLGELRYDIPDAVRSS